MNGAFLDANLTTGLSNNSLNSTIRGRYLFSSRQGFSTDNHAPVLISRTRRSARIPRSISRSRQLDLDRQFDLQPGRCTRRLLDRPRPPPASSPGHRMRPRDRETTRSASRSRTTERPTCRTSRVSSHRARQPGAGRPGSDGERNRGPAGHRNALARDPRAMQSRSRSSPIPPRGAFSCSTRSPAPFVIHPPPNASASTTFQYRVNDGRTDSQIRHR